MAITTANLCQQNDKTVLTSDQSLVGPRSFIVLSSRYVNQWDLARLPIQHLRHYSAALLRIYPIVANPHSYISQWAKEAIVSGLPPRRVGSYTGWSSIRIPSGRGT